MDAGVRGFPSPLIWTERMAGLLSRMRGTRTVVPCLQDLDPPVVLNIVGRISVTVNKHCRSISAHFALGIAVAAVLLVLPGASAATLMVGPGNPYSLPCKAIAAAHDGDTILIDAAGTYIGDRCYIRANNLTIQGINGRPHLLPPANGWALDGKGLWNIDGKNTTIDNIEISGVWQPGNGAAIRFEGQNLTLRNCYFHDNNDGLLTNETNIGNILIEYSEFDHNGAGDGQSHNIYINKADSFTMRYSYSHDAKVGHLVKSRAFVNYILYNRLSDEEGNASYELDIPVGGTTYVIGNVIEQGPNSQNSGIITYGEESIYSWGALNPNSSLYVVNNTIVNDKSTGTFVTVSPNVTAPALIQNNIFAGPGTLTNQKSAQLQTNLFGVDPEFVNRAAYDYQLQPSSPAIGQGSQPPSIGSFSLSPASVYAQSACGAERASTGLMDIGAYQYGGVLALSNVDCGGGPILSGIAPTLRLSASTLPSGGSGVLTVGLNEPAPAGGAKVFLAASSTKLITVPSSVVIAAGQTSAAVAIQAGYVPVTSNAIISASYVGQSVTIPISVAAGPPTLAGVSLSDYNSGTFTIQLTGAAPVGGLTVQISIVGSSVLAGPSSVTVPQGALTASFAVLSCQMKTATTGLITASYQGIVKSTSVTYNAYAKPYFTLNGSTIKAGTDRHGNYGISAPAPVGGFTATLISSDPGALSVPATFYLAPGQNYSWFPISAGKVTQPTSVTVTAAYEGCLTTATVVVNP